MRIKGKGKVEGLKGLEAALLKIGKHTTSKSVGRRALKKAAQPMADLGSSLAPVGESVTLAPSVTVSPKLSKRQKRRHRKMFAKDKAAVEMFVGAGPLPSAHNQEFGNEHHAAQPFMRPAWDTEGEPTLDRLGPLMWAEVEGQAKRAARTRTRKG